MAKRTPAAKSGATDEITDEWGIYDPGKAGMPALFKRLGRPVLQASSRVPRNERRRALRPERTPHGVGLAIEEARRRAAGAPPDGFETIPQSPARAMRNALRHHHGAAEPVHFVPDPVERITEPAEHAPPERAPEPPPVRVIAPPAPPRRKRASKRSARGASASAAPDAAAPHPPERDAAAVARHDASPEDAAAGLERPRGRRPARARQVAREGALPAAHDDAPVASAVAAESGAPAVKSGPPAPSPRRPRGPVPLAAWARASHEAPAQPPRRLDPLGFWRGWFRMPAEVALVEYARGARIHRLLIESIEDQPADFF